MLAKEETKDKESILIVDDDEATCRILTLLFAKNGYETEMAGTGREALEKVQGRFFNVALLDIRLPDLEGIELIAPLKEIHPEMAVIMVTAYASVETAARALQEGASAYITKPFNIYEVLANVRTALEKQHLLIENRRLYAEAQRELAERKKMQAQLIQAEKMRAMATMTAGIAHELLNPMMGMLNFAQYCIERTAEDDPRHPVLQDIERETWRCADIVKNLATFSRVEEQGEEGYQKESIATVIDRVVKLLSYRIGQQNVSVTQHIADGTPEVWMSASSIQQVFLNLISNALDAVEESNEKEIRVDAHREGDFIQVTVADSGCGIAPENLEKIYDPFFTTKPIGQGTGLGLTISRSIIDSHGGDISCESKPGAGTTFEVLLPVETKGGTK